MSQSQSAYPGISLLDDDGNNIQVVTMQPNLI